MESNRSARRRAASRRSQRRLTYVALVAVLLGACWVVFDARNGVALVATGCALLWFTSMRIAVQLQRADEDDSGYYEEELSAPKNRSRRRSVRGFGFITSRTAPRS